MGIESDHNPEKGCIHVVIHLDSTPSGFRNIVAITQVRPLRNRANARLNEINIVRIEERILRLTESQIILIPTETGRNRF